MSATAAAPAQILVGLIARLLDEHAVPLAEVAPLITQAKL